MSNSLARQLMMIRMIPRFPSKISTKDLKVALEDNGYLISQRSIQRDLKALSVLFPDLLSDNNPDVAGWSWKRSGELQDIPAIDPPMALTFMLAHEHLSKIMPPTILNQMEPYFSSSKKVLNTLNNQAFSAWPNRVRIISEYQTLLPADIQEDVIFGVYTGLLEGKQIKAQYTPRDDQERSYVLHPQGLVVHHRVIYLVAIAWDYEDPRHFALHRFSKCELLDEKSRIIKGFGLDEYISSGAFEYIDTKSKQIRVTLIFDATTAYHLEETPLSTDQEITHKRDGRVQIRATVNDSQQLRWWILGFGDQVEVIKPRSIRYEIVEILKNMNQLYKGGS